MILLGISIALILLTGIFELASYTTYGPIRTGSPMVQEWLYEGGVELNRFNNNIMTKFPDELDIDYISKDPFPIFSKWHVRALSGNNFRILRGTKLHKEIEEKQKQLLTQAKYTL